VTVLNTRRVVLLPIALGLVVGLTGCSQSLAGNATPRPTTVATDSEPTSRTSATSTKPTGGSGTALEDINPCTDLLTEAEIRDLHAEPGVPSVRNSCRWSVSEGPAFAIALRGDKGLDDITTGTLSNESIGGRKAKRQVDDPGPGSCMVALEVGVNSRVDVVGVADIDTARACDYATRVATLIEPRLPKE
jgi:hypothetical protein